MDEIRKMDLSMPLEVERYPIACTKIKGKEVFWNVYEGIMSSDKSKVMKEDVQYQMIKLDKFVKGLAIQYDSNNEMICIMCCLLKLDFNKDDYKVKNGDVLSLEPKQWTVLHRTFIDKEKNAWINARTIATINHYITYALAGSYSFDYASKYLEDDNYSCGTLTSSLYGYPNSKIVIINSPYIMKQGKEKAWYEYELMKPFHDMFGEVVGVVGNKFVALDSLSAFMQYYFKEGKVQKFSDGKEDLLDLPLEDVKIQFPQEKGLPPMLNNRLYKINLENVRRCAMIQKVKTDIPMCVVRIFFASYYSDNYVEGSRLYVSSSEAIMFKNVKGNLMRSRMDESSNSYNMPLLNFDKNILQGTLLQYFKEIVETLPDAMKTNALYNFLKTPFVEKMYKIPFLTEITKAAIVCSLKGMAIEELAGIFVTPRVPIEKVKDKMKKENIVWKGLGLNAYQAELVADIINKHYPCHRWTGNSYHDTNSHVVYWYKVMMTNSSDDFDSIPSIDNETSKIVADVCKLIVDSFLPAYTTQQAIDDMLNGKYPKVSHTDAMKDNDEQSASINMFDVFSAAYNTCCCYSIPVMAKTIPWIIERIKNDDTNGNYERFVGRQRLITMYNDYIKMVKELGMTSSLKPYFNTVNELMEAHDMVAELYRYKKENVDMSKWNKRKDVWNQFSYKEDTFSIIVPDIPNDLATEGITLHHCVKSYITRVSNGETNIVFIRKNDALDTPFYTVEVDTMNQIQQVHGFANCIATDEVLDFVNRWAKAKKLRLVNINKVR